MAEAALENYVPRARATYDNVVRQKLIEEFGYKNPMQVPKLDKIVLNIGAGSVAVGDSKHKRRRRAPQQCA